METFLENGGCFLLLRMQLFLSLISESSQLTTPDKVNELITQFTSALQYHSSNRSRDSPQKFAKLVLILPQLKHLVNQVIELLTNLKMQERCVLSDLVVEMLEAKQRL